MAQVGKALVLSEQGGPEVLSIDPSYKTPAPGAHELQVKITATSMEHVSWIVRQGYFGALGKTPEVLGNSASGTVVSVGEGVTKFGVGEHVFFLTDGAFSSPVSRGTLCEYQIVKEDEVAKVPAGLSLVEAAGVPLPALTAAEALSVAPPKHGQHVFVFGAGAVGLSAAQQAKAAGAHVTIACSEHSAHAVKAIGAHPYRYDEPDAKWAKLVASHAHGFDLVVDLMGKEALDAAVGSLLKPTGAVAHVQGPYTDATKVKEYSEALGPRFLAVVAKPSGARLEAVAHMIADKKYDVPKPFKTFPLEQAAEAMELVHKGAAGRVIVVM